MIDFLTFGVLKKSRFLTFTSDQPRPNFDTLMPNTPEQTLRSPTNADARVSQALPDKHRNSKASGNRTRTKNSQKSQDKNQLHFTFSQSSQKVSIGQPRKWLKFR